ncbi:hypothetical protein [Nonomuraea dietziae]|uniref:hypothetical protein n=1 Tax=Nonomuraea dietziae TaxID=65515 RepID=UPI0031D18CA8
MESLRNDEIDWSPEDHRELLATADESLGPPGRLVANLLDMSRLQAGVLGLALQAVRSRRSCPARSTTSDRSVSGSRVTSPSNCPRSPPIPRCSNGSWST